MSPWTVDVMPEGGGGWPPLDTTGHPTHRPLGGGAGGGVRGGVVGGGPTGCRVHGRF